MRRQKPQRALLERPYLKESLKLPMPELLEEIFRNFYKEEREYQYYAIDLAQKNIKRFSLDDLAALLPLLGEKLGGTVLTLGAKFFLRGFWRILRRSNGFMRFFISTKIFGIGE